MLPDAVAGIARMVLVSDAWSPQVNGVVTTLKTTVATLESMGIAVQVIEPSLFRNFPCPTYPEIRLAWRPRQRIEEIVARFKPQAIHIATEGPLGYTMRRWCMGHGVPFTTAYHTQFPEYLAARVPLPLTVSYAWLRRFHGAAQRTMVATPALQTQLEARGFKNLVRWSRGVNTELFKPMDTSILNLPRPIMVYVGRVAVEKNIEAFLKLKLSGSKLIIGAGPALESMKAKYPDAHFVGYQFGETLAQHIAAADVFVFPSRTDTFGLVMLEAMACGLPVAAYPVTGPIDVVQNGINGVLNDDLETAVKQALTIARQACRDHALKYSWRAATEQFLGNLAPLNAETVRRTA
jgi:glycosyltransferase involved in cell wall biosynthesis